MKKYPKTSILITSILVLYLLLLIPLDNNQPTTEENKTPFIWNQDSLWKSLELKFISASAEGCDKIKFTVDSLISSSTTLLKEISADTLDPSDEKFITLENNIFNIAPLIPICTQYFSDYINFYSNLRNVVKEQSEKLGFE